MNSVQLCYCMTLQKTENTVKEQPSMYDLNKQDYILNCYVAFFKEKFFVWVRSKQHLNIAPPGLFAAPRKNISPLQSGDVQELFVVNKSSNEAIRKFLDPAKTLAQRNSKEYQNLLDFFAKAFPSSQMYNYHLLFDPPFLIVNNLTNPTYIYFSQSSRNYIQNLLKITRKFFELSIIYLLSRSIGSCSIQILVLTHGIMPLI